MPYGLVLIFTSHHQRIATLLRRRPSRTPTTASTGNMTTKMVDGLAAAIARMLGSELPTCLSGGGTRPPPDALERAFARSSASCTSELLPPPSTIASAMLIPAAPYASGGYVRWMHEYCGDGELRIALPVSMAESQLVRSRL